MSEDEKANQTTLSEAQAEAAVAQAEFEAAKAEAEDAKPEGGTLGQTTISDAVAASEAVVKAEASYQAAKEKLNATRAASEAAWKAGYEAAKAQVGEIDQAGRLFTNKRKQERIFRREMGEPEFFLMYGGPVKPILTGDEIEDLSRQVQIPKDQTPKYNPEHILSPEFSGGTNYESGIQDLIDETKQKLDQLLNDPEANPQEIELEKLALKKLDYLFENYNLGMNVFRTAKGGREKLRE